MTATTDNQGEAAMERFDEKRLRADIVSVWGEYGAHVDVFDYMLKELRERPTASELAYWKNLLTTRTETLRERAERAESEIDRLRIERTEAWHALDEAMETLRPLTSQIDITPVLRAMQVLR